MTAVVVRTAPLPASSVLTVADAKLATKTRRVWPSTASARGALPTVLVRTAGGPCPRRTVPRLASSTKSATPITARPRVMAPSPARPLPGTSLVRAGPPHPGRAPKDVAMAPTFGHLLRQHRKAAGLTQEELAEHACVSVRSIQAFEAGARQTPRSDTIDLLATALVLPPPERAAFTAAARRRPLLVSDSSPGGSTCAPGHAGVLLRSHA